MRLAEQVHPTDGCHDWDPQMVDQMEKRILCLRDVDPIAGDDDGPASQPKLRENSVNHSCSFISFTG